MNILTSNSVNISSTKPWKCEICLISINNSKVMHSLKYRSQNILFNLSDSLTQSQFCCFYILPEKFITAVHPERLPKITSPRCIFDKGLFEGLAVFKSNSPLRFSPQWRPRKAEKGAKRELNFRCRGCWWWLWWWWRGCHSHPKKPPP